MTLPLRHNYGGILQALALYKHLTDAGHTVVLLEARHSPSRRQLLLSKLSITLARMPDLSFIFEYKARLKLSCFDNIHSFYDKYLGLTIQKIVRLQVEGRFRSFINRHISIRSGAIDDSRQMIGAVKKFDLDTLIVGSDQVWRLDYLPRGMEGDFFFGFAEDMPLRKISYAASFGYGEWRYPEWTSRVTMLLEKFNSISVREDSGLAICSDTFNRQDAIHVLDPTLLHDCAFYDHLAAARREVGGHSVLQYILDNTPASHSIFSTALQALGPSYCTLHTSIHESHIAGSIPDWLRSFMDTDFVVTDSFHGTVFSILFEKPFIAILNEGRGADRFTSLLGQLGLLERLVVRPSPAEIERLAATAIDYAAVAPRLASLREQSAAYLERALA
nr:polysaccharide pyruvyl transferase family protein [Ancylobacter koreensis]